MKRKKEKADLGRSKNREKEKKNIICLFVQSLWVDMAEEGMSFAWQCH